MPARPGTVSRSARACVCVCVCVCVAAAAAARRVASARAALFAWQPFAADVTAAAAGARTDG